MSHHTALMIGLYVVLCFVSGSVAGSIGKERTGEAVQYFVLGAVLPILGIGVAQFSRKEAWSNRPPVTDGPTPAGWYPAPEDEDATRFWNGRKWTREYLTEA